MRFFATTTLTILGVLLLGISSGYSVVRHQPSDTLPWLAFISGDAYLYRMDADGDNLHQVSYTGHANAAPHWSSDGQWISFIKGGREVRGHRINLNGKMLESITEPIRLYGAIALSPDGQSVAFHNGFRLYSTDGSQIRELPVPRGQKSHLSWSPDGEWLVFVLLDRANGYNLYLIRPNGRDLTRITQEARQNFYPVWSPDSQWLAFVSSNSDFGFQVHKIRLDGTDRQQLTRRVMVANFSAPVWSPDGNWIAFSAQRGAFHWNIYRVRSDGTHQEQLTDLQHQNRNPSWSPDGKWIAFQAYQQGGTAVYRMNSNGSDLQRLTYLPESAKYPVWSPRTEFNWNPLLLIVLGVGTLIMRIYLVNR